MTTESSFSNNLKNVHDYPQYIEQIESYFDHQAWNSAQEKNTIEAYESYLANYPNGLFLEEAKTEISHIKASIKAEQELWEKTLKNDSIQGYETYLSSSALLKFKAEAESKLKYLQEDEEAWKKAQKNNSVNSMEVYLSAFPDGKYVNEAKNLKIKLQEHKDWKTAQKKNTIESYQEYLSSYPTGKYKEEASALLEELAQNKMEEEDFYAWDKASHINNKQSYQEYLDKYPNGKYKDQAKTKLDEILAKEKLIRDDERAWETAKDIDTKKSYERYLDKYPNGKFKVNARKRLDKISAEVKLKKQDEDAWKRALELSSVASMDNYLRKFPSGQYVDEAKKIKSELRESNEWVVAQNTHTIQRYQLFIQTYPAGKFSIQANQKLAELQAEANEERERKKAREQYNETIQAIGGWAVLIVCISILAWAFDTPDSRVYVSGDGRYYDDIPVSINGELHYLSHNDEIELSDKKWNDIEIDMEGFFPYKNETKKGAKYLDLELYSKSVKGIVEGKKGNDFVKISSTGAELGPESKYWECVLDKNSGALWTSGNFVLEWNTEKRIYEGIQSAIDQANRLGLCGQKNWTIPSLVALKSINSKYSMVKQQKQDAIVIGFEAEYALFNTNFFKTDSIRSSSYAYRQTKGREYPLDFLGFSGDGDYSSSRKGITMLRLISTDDKSATSSFEE